MNNKELDALIAEMLKLPKNKRLDFLREHSGELTPYALVERIGSRLIRTLPMTREKALPDPSPEVLDFLRRAFSNPNFRELIRRLSQE